jgi:hypothetical protein
MIEEMWGGGGMWKLDEGGKGGVPYERGELLLKLSKGRHLRQVQLMLEEVKVGVDTKFADASTARGWTWCKEVR